MMHHESTMDHERMSNRMVFGPQRVGNKIMSSRTTKWSVAPPASLESWAKVLSSCLWFVLKDTNHKQSNSRKGLSQSTHIRTRKMVIYACVGARSEETLMEALV